MGVSLVANRFRVRGVLDCILTVFDCKTTAAPMRPDDMLESFAELTVKDPDLMRLVLQFSLVAQVNVQSMESVDAEFNGDEFAISI